VLKFLNDIRHCLIFDSISLGWLPADGRYHVESSRYDAIQIVRKRRAA